MDDEGEPPVSRGLRRIPDADNGSIPAASRWLARQWWANLVGGALAIHTAFRDASLAVVAGPVGVAFMFAGLALLRNLVRERRGRPAP